MKYLTWKKKFFGGIYEVFDSNMKIAEILPQMFSYNMQATTGSGTYYFKTKGFFKPKLSITDSIGNIIGEVKFSTWLSKADITINGKIYKLAFNNRLGSCFSLNSLDGQRINYHVRTCSGEINSMDDDELSIIAGLFAYNYFSQVTLTVICLSLLTVNIPNLMRLFH